MVRGLDVFRDRFREFADQYVRIAIEGRVKGDMRHFLDKAGSDQTIQPKAIGLNLGLGEILQRIAAAYGL